MKLIVAHFLRRLDRIDRDLQEIEKLQASLQTDRDYAGRLKDSLSDEAIRMKKLRGRILSLVVKDPPGFEESAPVSAAVIPSTDTGSAEIILPGKGRKSEKKKEKSSEPAAESADEPFRFRFN